MLRHLGEDDAMDIPDLLPLAAAIFAVPQFLPQLRRLARSQDSSGLSPAWSALTCVNNTAWIVYFVQVGYRTASVPNACVVIMSALLTVRIVRLDGVQRVAAGIVGGWSSMLVASLALAGVGGLQVLLTVAFVVQVVPSLWAAYRSAAPDGIAIGTWLLVLAEMVCWLSFGAAQGDRALIVLGVSGVSSSVAMIVRASTTRTPSTHTPNTHTPGTRTPALPVAGTPAVRPTPADALT